MSRILAAVLAVTTACTTTSAQSSAGLFVADMQVHGAALVVSRCELGLTVGTNHGVQAANAAIAVLSVLTLSGGGGGGNSKTMQTTATNCVTQNRGAL